MPSIAADKSLYFPFIVENLSFQQFPYFLQLNIAHRKSDLFGGKLPYC